MPSIKEANGGEGDKDGAPITLLLARFIQFFCLQIDGPVVVAIVVVWRRGGHEPEVPRGGADGDGKRLGAVVLLLAKQRLGGLCPAITGNKKLHRNDEFDSNEENEVHK
jgi:hypothetical protein